MIHSEVLNVLIGRMASMASRFVPEPVLFRPAVGSPLPEQKKRGMQAVGIVNDHAPDCFRRKAVLPARKS